MNQLKTPERMKPTPSNFEGRGSRRIALVKSLLPNLGRDSLTLAMEVADDPILTAKLALSLLMAATASGFLSHRGQIHQGEEVHQAVTPSTTVKASENYYLTESEDIKKLQEKFAFDKQLFEEVVGDPRLGITNPQTQQRFAEMMAAISLVESKFNQYAGWPRYIKGESNPAIGLTQIKLKNIRAMVQKYGFEGNIFDKRVNLLAGTAYFREVYQQFPDFEIAASAYYLGEGRLILGIQEAVIARLGEQMREAVLASFEQMGLAPDEDRATTHYINTMGITLEEILKNPRAVDRMMQNQNYIEDSREITQHAKRYGDALEALGFGKDFLEYRNLPMS